MDVVLRELDQTNWLECAELEVREDQKGLVASNLYSIAQSRFFPTMVPQAIYHKDTMVGFVMHGQAEDSVYWIIRMMIDKNYQRKGYGWAVALRVLDALKEKPDCKEIKISFEPENAVAEKLYLSLGFEETGEMEGGEKVLRYPVRPPV